MKIVMLAHFAGSPVHGMVYGHYYLAREWIRAGHEVTIVSASFSHVRARQPVARGRAGEEIIDGIRYIWLPTLSYRPEQTALRVLNLLAFSLRSWLACPRIGPADLVVCSSHHPFAIHAALRLARRWRARLVFEVRDLWPLTLIELGRASTKHPLIRAMQWSEDRAYRHADTVVSVLPNARDYMVGRGMAPEKFVHVPNGIPLGAVHEQRPLPQGHIREIERQRGLGRMLVGYAGRIGEANALFDLADAMARIDDKPLAVLLMGHGQHAEALRAHVQGLGLGDRFLLLDPVAKSQVPAFLQRVDVAYIGLRKSPLFRHGVSPNKLNDYMLAGKPIVCAIDTPENPVELSGSGLVCPPEDPQAIALALSAMLEMSPQERAGLGARGRSWLLEHRDSRVLAQRFLEAAMNG